MSEDFQLAEDLAEIKQRMLSKYRAQPETILQDSESAKRFEKLWRDTGVGDRHEEPLRNGTYQLQPEVKYVNGLEPGWTVAFLGPRGTGKTQAGAALIWQRCREGRSARYVHVNELLLRLKACWREKTRESELDVLRELAQPSLVFLDEAQERSEDQWDTRMLANLIDLRYRARRDTIIGTNADKASFDKAMGPSILRRLTDTSRGPLQFLRRWKAQNV
jgi:DNA replication protein DnaC